MSTTDVPEQLAERIANLLNKAESTEFPEEAEAFLAKAQELMARHAIDEAMLANARGTTEAITQIELVVIPPYASAKSSLLSAVAQANRCKVVYRKQPGGQEVCTVFGHETDLSNARQLYFSLSHQALRFMLEAPLPPGDTKRKFRHSFLLAYGWRIGQRLAEAARAASKEAESDQLREAAGRSVSLVLASRDAKVDRAMREAFPNLRNRSVSASSSGGLQSGRAAADRSSLGQPGMGSGGRSLPGG